MAVGPHDLSAGIDSLFESSLKGVPWISANIRDTDNKLLFAPWRIVESDNFKTGIIGLTGLHRAVDSEYRVLPWQDVLPEIVSSLSPVCDFVVLLSNMTDSINREIASTFPQIQLIIGADSRIGNKVPLLVHNSIITQTHTRGKYFGRFQITWNNIPVWDKANRSEVITNLLNDDVENNTKGRIAINERYRNQLINATNLPDPQPDGGTYNYRFIPLNKAIPEDPGVVAILNNLQNNIRSQNKKSAANSAETNQAEKTFAGSESCVECHRSQVEFWSTTGHAKAYDTLVIKQQQYNLDCLACHVTWDLDSGLEKGATNLLTLATDMQAVGCEMCHGPLPLHPEGADLPAKTSVDTCTRCHTAEMDNTFSYKAMVTKIQCPEG